MAYWHIRMNQEGQNFARGIWNAGRVGMWLSGGLGGFCKAWNKDPDVGAIAQTLYRAAIGGRILPLGRVEKWVRTAIKLRGHFQGLHADRVPADVVGIGDWVYTCFDGHVHVGRISSDVQPGGADDTPEGEQFFHREITDCRSFRLGDIPEWGRLLSGVGRETLCHPNSYLRQVEMLATNDTKEKVWIAFNKYAIEDRLDMYGPGGWEAFCVAYLILENGFLPTGLATGRTLQGLDIVGRDSDGCAVYAECKKNPDGRPLGKEDLKQFHEALGGVPDKAHVFLFAYGDCADKLPPRVTKKTRDDVLRWLTGSEKGRSYAKLLGLDPE